MIIFYTLLVTSHVCSNKTSYVTLSVLKVKIISYTNEDEGDYNADDDDNCDRNHFNTSDLVQLHGVHFNESVTHGHK